MRARKRCSTEAHSKPPKKKNEKKKHKTRGKKKKKNEDGGKSKGRRTISLPWLGGRYHS